MAWYDEAVFYHIYPLGMTGAPKHNSYEAPVHRLNLLIPWISHIKDIGCNAIYIGPLFESVGHGYETTDYMKLDSRLGTNDDLKEFVSQCHNAGIRVIFDGVFNHTGRDFFAFKDILANRENSQYKDWYCNVNFHNNNEYNDGFSYDNWGDYNLLAKLNQNNPAVVDYICNVIRFWVEQFDVDGIRLDAADVLDFNFMKALRNVANEVKPDFWLMGEVIHGDYTRWVNEGTLHSVTNYHLHKALYSGHNEHNYFEIAHTVRRLYEMGGNRPDGLKLYNFVDNHDVERIFTKLNNKKHYYPVHVLLYTLPGVPSIYYGSEFGIDGKKERGSDDSLRPELRYDDYKNAINDNDCTRLIAALGKIRRSYRTLSYGAYQELMLTNRQYAFTKQDGTHSILVAVNNDDNEADINISAEGCDEYIGTLSGTKIIANNGRVNISLPANSGEIFVPSDIYNDKEIEPVVIEKWVKPETDNCCCEQKSDNNSDNTAIVADNVDASQDIYSTDEEILPNPIEETQSSEPEDEDVDSALTSQEVSEHNTEAVNRASSNPENAQIWELQCAILAKMAGNGPVTEQMRRTVLENEHHGSLVNWLKSFR